MVSGRLTPPDVQDGPYGWEPGAVGTWSDEHQTEGATLDAETAQKIARDSYEASTNWINSGRRAEWNNSLRAFNSLHPTGSKYLSREYNARSTLFRPKTRTMVRRDEMATASAFFANEDVVSIQAGDPDDPKQAASAAIIQALLQYRLTKTIPWFLTLVGARQDTEVMGICVARAGWKYEEKYSHTENQMVQAEDGSWEQQPTDVMRKVKDEPFVDLIAAENIRFEPGADWRDPFGTSPYIIELVPMYVQDVMEKIDAGEWKAVPKSALAAASDIDDDVTRRSREPGRVPGKDHDAWKPRDFDICWVRRNIIKWGGEDWHFYTLGSAGEMLTDPVLLKEVELHGERPYVGGFVVLETHKTYPSSKVELTRDLQRAANDDWNLRFDNVKMVLNPRQFVRAGIGIELNDLQRFAPGKTVMVASKPGSPMNEDIMWDRPPPPDASAYAEQDRINLDFDGLTGAFSNSSVQASQNQQQSATGMHLMSGEASGLTEYELRVFSESFVEPLIRLLVKIEQAYETDPTILALAGKTAQLLQKYGINEITDELLNQEVTTRVNVGIGATNPQLRLRGFLAGGEALGKMFGPVAAQGFNFEEVSKEVMALLGYKDGTRFLTPQFDPRVAMLQQELQKLQGKAKAGPPPPDPQKTALEHQKVALDAYNDESDNQRDQQRLQLEAAKFQLSIRQQDLEEARFRYDMAMGAREQTVSGREQAATGQAADVDAKQAAVDEAKQHVVALHAGLQNLGQMVNTLGQQHAEGHAQMLHGLGQLAAIHSAPRRVVRGADGRVAGVEIARPDGA